jgi:alkylation response protein AidB-like acyl-CoA dehydrogenase
VEPFYEVTFDGVVVTDDAVLGPVGAGWLVLSAGLTIERTGIDYNAKARQSLTVAADLLAGAPDEPVLTDRLVDLQTLAAAGRLLAWHPLECLDDDLSADQAADSKWFNAELGVHAPTLACRSRFDNWDT